MSFEQSAAPRRGLALHDLPDTQVDCEPRGLEAAIQAHLCAIPCKLGANNRTQAVLLAGKLAVDPDKVVPRDEGDAS